MGGFSNPILGGGGGLVYPSIHSPDFNQAAQTGWSIDKNGNAFFFSITVAGSIIASATGGVFLYDGIPGAGNPPVEYAADSSVTHDPFGNVLAVPGGFVSVSPTSWAQLAGGQFNFKHGSFISESTGGLLTFGGGVGVNAIQWLIPSGLLTAAKPGTNAFETWHSIVAGFPAGWSGRFSYQLLVTGEIELDWSFTITSGTAVTDGETILAAALPAAYRPLSGKPLPGLQHVTAGSAYAAVQVNSSGDIIFNGAGSSVITLFEGTGTYSTGI